MTKILALILPFMLLSGSIMPVPYTSRYVKNYTAKEKEEFLSMVKETPIMADVIQDCSLFSSAEGKTVVNEIKAGITVEVLEDFSMEKYLIRDNLTGVTGWAESGDLLFPADTPSEKNEMTLEELEGYVNIKGLSSKTEYLVFTDINRQLTHVFKGKQYRWKLLRTMPCASGKNKSPTTRGLFKIVDRGEWFYSERLGSGGKYWMRFNGNYLFHSVPMDKNRNILDNTVGERVSSGCIRLRVPDIEWLYKNIPDSTTVFIV